MRGDIPLNQLLLQNLYDVSIYSLRTVANLDYLALVELIRKIVIGLHHHAYAPLVPLWDGVIERGKPCWVLQYPIQQMVEGQIPSHDDASAVSPHAVAVDSL